MKVTFNPSNWVDDNSVTINVDVAKKTWKQFGYDCKLVKTEEYVDAKYGAIFYDLLLDGEVVGKVTENTGSDDKGDKYEAGDEYIKRSGDNIFVAAGQYLCNVI